MSPELHTCPICNQQGYAPEVVPYVLMQGKGHVWCHPQCRYALQQAKNAQAGPLFPVEHENGDGQ